MRDFLNSSVDTCHYENGYDYGVPQDRIKASLEEILSHGIAQGVAPGMACAVGTGDKVWIAFSGNHRYDSGSPRIDEDTLWDIASLTKIVSTTNIAMVMNTSGDIDLDDRVQRSVLEFVGDEKHDVTIRHLLQHTSGLPAYGDYTKITNALEVKDEILRCELVSLPGSKEIYSCLGFVALAEVLERQERIGLDQLFEQLIVGPLGLQNTFYKPQSADRLRCAPTERTTDWRRRLEDMRGFCRVDDEYICGTAHDPIAYLTGGISGNAGLFSTPFDLAKIAQAWLSDTNSIFNQSIMNEYSKVSIPGIHGLGFDTKSLTGSQAGSRFSSRTFGHTGFTGTRMWIDPESAIFGILLSNRVHPTANNLKISDFSPAYFDAIYDMLSH